MSTVIRHQFFYAHPAEGVWDYLTKPELMSQWLMDNDFKPIVGHNFQFTTKPIPSLDLDGIFHCKVLEIIPYKKLSYSWKGGPRIGEISFDTVVEWTLIEKENGTELHLEHSGFKEDVNYPIYAGMNEGWRKKMQKVDEMIRAHNVQDSLSVVIDYLKNL